MTKKINTLYGPVTLHEPILIELISSNAMQRLKLIHQYGIFDYVVGPQGFTRYDHSIRVMTLLRTINASLLEQIAGLLHDVSHTVFSHLADVIFSIEGNDSYQDDIHKWYIEHTDIPVILEKYGVTINDILHKKGTFLALEQDLPDLCADRVSYLLDGGYVERKLNKKMIREILKHVHFNDGIWFFDSHKHARIVADIALYLTEDIFAAPWNIMMNHWAAEGINYALKKGIITKDEIHFSTDDTVWHKLTQSTDPMLATFIKKALHVHDSFYVSSQENYDLYITAKFRGVDPYIQQDGSLIRLSKYDNEFGKKFESIRDKLHCGWHVKFS